MSRRWCWLGRFLGPRASNSGVLLRRAQGGRHARCPLLLVAAAASHSVSSAQVAEFLHTVLASNQSSCCASGDEPAPNPARMPAVAETAPAPAPVETPAADPAPAASEPADAAETLDSIKLKVSGKAEISVQYSMLHQPGL